MFRFSISFLFKHHIAFASPQVDMVLQVVRQALAEGYSPVVSLWMTGEKQSRRIFAGSEDRARSLADSSTLTSVCQGVLDYYSFEPQIPAPDHTSDSIAPVPASSSESGGSGPVIAANKHGQSPANSVSTPSSSPYVCFGCRSKSRNFKFRGA